MARTLRDRNSLLAGSAAAEAQTLNRGSGGDSRRNYATFDRGHNSHNASHYRPQGSGDMRDLSVTPLSDEDEETSIAFSYTPKQKLRHIVNAVLRTVTRPDGEVRTFHAWARDTLPIESLVHFLIATGFVTGVLDATVYHNFRTYASNQTGNTVLLGLSIIGPDRSRLRDVGTSLGAFALTAFVFGQSANRIASKNGGRRRWWVLLSSLYQTSALLLAVALVWPDVVTVDGPHAWVIILLLASSSGAQVAMARQFTITEIPTAMVTSPLVDLLVDPYLLRAVLWRKETVGRNRRVVYITSLFVGVLVGATIHKFKGTKPVLLMAALMKLCIGVGFALIPNERPTLPTSTTTASTDNASHVATGSDI